MKNLRKIVLFTAIFVLCSSLFAAETKKEVPKKDETEQSVKKDLHLYYGANIGLVKLDILGESTAGFELSPKLGMYPFKNKNDLFIEFDLQLQFFSYDYNGLSDSNVKWTVVTPLFLFGNKYEIGSFKPYWKAGFGLNFNSGKVTLFGDEEKITGSPSFCLVVNPGAEFAINKNFVLSLDAKFCTNKSKASIDGYEILDSICLDSKSFGVGLKYCK